MNLDDLPLFRAQDPPTSRAGAGDIRLRLGSQQAQLLAVYAANPNGLTDEQAGNLSGLSANRSCCYWKRCGELLEAGYIEDTGEERRSQAGEMQRVCRVTAKGRGLIQ